MSPRMGEKLPFELTWREQLGLEEVGAMSTLWPDGDEYMPKTLEELLESSQNNQWMCTGFDDCTHCEMARRLRKLSERHSPMGDCPDCADPYHPPCSDREILDGGK